MLHCILATKKRNVINFRKLSRLHLLIILSGSKVDDSLLLSYAQTSSSFTLICWSVSSVSAVFLIACKLCKSDWLTDWLTDWRAIGTWVFKQLQWRTTVAGSVAFLLWHTNKMPNCTYRNHLWDEALVVPQAFSPTMWSFELVRTKVFKLVFYYNINFYLFS